MNTPGTSPTPNNSPNTPVVPTPSSTGQPNATPGANNSPNATSGTGSPNGSPGTPGNAPGGGGGIKITLNGQEYLVPNEVQEVGVAPSDWIKLPQEMQDQLLHAAQQPGPPEYRDMIKNYYSRIARMQSQNAPATGGNP
jgi:hypothetical protein